MLDKNRNHGLPAFLAADAGVDSGLMIAQYTQAALVSDNKRLAVPASVDSIPSSAMQEDHVSMGWHAARKLRSAIKNLTQVLGIELVASARAIEMRAPLKPGPVSASVISEFRKFVAGPGVDRYLSPELRAANDFVASGFFKQFD
jgi:histidine ammonia-lyase